MKMLMLGLILLGFAGRALAIEPLDLDNRLHSLTDLFEDMQTKPDRSVPPEVLRNAKGILLIDRTKAGFGFAFQHGAGVALVRDEAGRWSPPAFVEANAGSIGFQAGGEQAFIVIVLMNTNATRQLLEPNAEFAAEARATGGYSSGGASSKTPLEHQALVFSDRNGLFGGVDFKFGGLNPDNDANMVYYSKSVTMQDILFDHQVTVTDAGRELIQSLAQQAKVATAPHAGN
jgi:SH3 domain-containing YSC84-like protein 1